MCPLKKRRSLKFRKIHRKTPVQSLFFNKVAGLRLATLLKKKTLAQVFSCEFCEISKKTFSTEQPQTTASEEYLQVIESIENN